MDDHSEEGIDCDTSESLVTANENSDLSDTDEALYLEAAGNILESLRQDCRVESTDLGVFSFTLLGVSDVRRERLLEVVFTEEFCELLIRSIQRKHSGYLYLLCALGNGTSSCPKHIGDRIALTPGLIETLKVLHADPSSDITPTGESVCETALWITANLVQSCSHEVLSLFEPMIPALCTELEHGSTPSTPRTHYSQSYMKAFRSLCTLLPASDARLSKVFRSSSPSHGRRQHRALHWLIDEYSVALKGSNVHGTTFYPDPDDRAITVSRLTADPVGRTAVLAAGVVPLLAQSMLTPSSRGVLTTRRLWTASVRAVHDIAACPETYPELLRVPDVGQGLMLVASLGRQVGMPFATRRLAADAALAVHAQWSSLRLLWVAITKRQNTHRCPLSVLLPECVRRIALWWVLTGGYEAS
mmetsp:Transcript_1004/g.2179  ORF Transcript_1004/g.2179 Transcript_1004/m.2179 type:complete len:416 (-) Transcript_1004:204-1451(-)